MFDFGIQRNSIEIDSPSYLGVQVVSQYYMTEVAG